MLSAVWPTGGRYNPVAKVEAPLQDWGEARVPTRKATKRTRWWSRWLLPVLFLPVSFLLMLVLFLAAGQVGFHWSDHTPWDLWSETLTIGGFLTAVALVRWRGGPVGPQDSQKTGLPLAWPLVGLGYLLASVGAGSLGMLLSDQLGMGDDAVISALVAEAVEAGPTSGMFWRMLLSVTVIAAFWEEWLFRHWLWRRLEQHFPQVHVWWITSLLFLLMHLDPDQIVGIVFVAFALGVVRWRTGNWWYGVIIHFAHNAVATVPDVLQQSLLPSLPAAAWGAIGGAGLVGFLWLTKEGTPFRLSLRKPPEDPGSPVHSSATAA